MTGHRLRLGMARLPALVALLMVLAGCAGSKEPVADGPTTPAPSQPHSKALTLVPFHNANFGSTRLDGCASMADHVYQRGYYAQPLLIWVRLRAAERLRLLPSTYSDRSNFFDSVTQYLGPDPGPRAPNLAVSIGPVGEGPTADRMEYDTHLIGDARHSPVGVAAAKTSWEARVPLKHGVPIGPGDHYLFLEIDPAPGGMDVHALTVRWARDGKPGHQLLGELSARLRCGG